MEFSASQIAMLLGGKIIGDGNKKVSDVAPIEQAAEGKLSFLCDEKFVGELAHIEGGVVLISKPLLISPGGEEIIPETGATLILVENARGAMAELLKLVAKAMNPAKKGIEQPSFVSEGVEIPEDAYVGAFAYIGKNVKIGKGAQIYPQVYVGDNCVIGENTILYSGVKIYYNCVVGKDCILHSGCVVGADGFGFEPDQNRVNQKVPQIGNVIIEDDVELGANTCVDRAMMGSTIVRKNAKVDNLVQIAHNCQVGESDFLCAQVGLAGSTNIGKHCILTGQVGVAGHLTIADDCIFGAKSGISSDVKKPGMYQGAPIMDAITFRRASAVIKQLPDMYRTVNRLAKKLED